MDQDVGDQHKMKALWGHFGTLQHGIILSISSVDNMRCKSICGQSRKYGIRRALVHLQVRSFLAELQEGGGWACMLADSKQCDWGCVRKITSHMTLMGS